MAAEHAPHLQMTYVRMRSTRSQECPGGQNENPPCSWRQSRPLDVQGSATAGDGRRQA
ncbi:MAG: hypothetical protein ACK55Z_19775 [bacterium]